MDATEENMKLGRLKFETYCSACHGYAGNGDGLVHKRADALAQGYWLPPTSLHIDRVRNQPVGQIFHTITKGQGKMGSYASALSPKERWAIVLYVRALQRSRNANIDDVPVEMRSKLDDQVVADTP
jgi:mono/diheme cytochrome c family protein